MLVYHMAKSVIKHEFPLEATHCKYLESAILSSIRDKKLWTARPVR
jgi:hypothetical protein